MRERLEQEYHEVLLMGIAHEEMATVGHGGRGKRRSITPDSPKRSPPQPAQALQVRMMGEWKPQGFSTPTLNFAFANAFQGFSGLTSPMAQGGPMAGTAM